MKQTAVEWLAEALAIAYKIEEISLRNFTIKKLIKQAKKIEKEQIMNAHYEGSENYKRQYYNETFTRQKQVIRLW
jgi:hypothetical protein